jgi:hypothetical protein
MDGRHVRPQAGFKDQLICPDRLHVELGVQSRFAKFFVLRFGRSRDRATKSRPDQRDAPRREEAGACFLGSLKLELEILAAISPAFAEQAALRRHE